MHLESWFGPEQTEQNSIYKITMLKINANKLDRLY